MKRQRVSTLVAVFMGGLAITFDGLQFFLLFLNVIPVAGTAIAFLGSWFVAALAGIVFYMVWFPLLGVQLTKGKSSKLINVLLSAVLEATPLLDALPGISYGVISTIILSRLEDAAYNKAHAAETKAAKEAERRRQVLMETRARRQAQETEQLEAEAEELV